MGFRHERRWAGTLLPSVWWLIFNKGLLRHPQNANCLGISEEAVLSEMLLLLFWHPETLQEVYLYLHGPSCLGRYVGTLGHSSCLC